jgi:hypothetical protein
MSSTVKEHWQGFAYVKTPIKLTGWKKILPGAHIESIRGDFQSNEKHCSKERLLIQNV